MIDQFRAFIEESLFLKDNIDWISQVFLVVLVTMVAGFVSNLILRRLEQKLSRTNTLWDDAFVGALRKPIAVILWILGIGFAAEVLHEETKTPLFSAVPEISEVLFIAAIGWGLIRFIKRGSAAFVDSRRRRGKPVDITTIDAVSNLLKASILITTALIILQALGYSINAVLTFGGIGGIAVGFAAQDLLSNFFGAMMIYFDKPFKIGDWVRSPDRNIEGVVEKIGWRMTTIRTFDKRPLYVPNSVFTKIAVQNPSRMTNRRIYETIGIRYNDIAKMEAITNDIREMLKQHKEIDQSQVLIVNFNAFNASSCDFFVYCLTVTTDWVKFHQVKHNILLSIADIISNHQSEIAYPTQTLHMPDIENQMAQMAQS